ncbi:hypothetical protein H2198_003072 [Neophaeococcomyces mojaviensis]|uniref:Uncharacterized protein n=1 Tax=Neophaeococcomyces mojaviensis TaxID=3383035 RepID=A0ACC3ACY6_9EURO|nr:hypothetical protein H2198_003072 [Knufia sp. JES_112]
MYNSHKGLPAPLGLTLGPPDQGHEVNLSLGNLVEPPSRWAGQDESMRNWLQAKAEEDKRKQEEERTKQENLRLDQRKIEQNMLRDSLNGGVPPPMVPLIFAGMCGGNLSSHTLEWTQQYLAQMGLLNQQQQIQQHQYIQHQGLPPSKIHRDSRMILPSSYSAQEPPMLSTTQTVNRVSQDRSLTCSTSEAYLSQRNTAKMQPHLQPTSRHSMHPLQKFQTAQTVPGSAPSLLFHHWTPPNDSSGQPPAPSKSQHGAPSSQHAPSHLRSGYQNLSKKGKLGGSQANNAPAASQPSEMSFPGSSH